MPATVNGSLSMSERQQQSLEDAWFFQLALLRLQHNVFCHNGHKHQGEQFAATSFQHDCNMGSQPRLAATKAAATAAATKQQLVQPTHGALALLSPLDI